MKDFERRFEDLKREHQNGNLFDKASAFLDFHLEWAEALSATDPAAAIRQYRCAEDCQSTIGSGATSGGEGLASMTELYRIIGKRADLTERAAELQSDLPARLAGLEEALSIWTRILNDRNHLGELTPAASKVEGLTLKIRTFRS
jgi:hypothetical protein